MHYVHRSEPAEPSAISSVDERETEPTKSEPRFPALEPEPAEPEAKPEVGAAAPPTPVVRVQQSLITPGDEQPIRREEVLRGYEVEPDQYVVFDRDELRKLQRRTSTNMEIVRSVRLSEIDPVFFETSYYVVPDRGGEKAYTILFESLKETQHVALARVGMYGREHVVIVRPGEHGILAHTMFYVDEIRFENEFRANPETIGAKELELAKTFLEAIEAPFAPEEFKDLYREELQAMIAEKRSAAGPAPAIKEAAGPEPVVDIPGGAQKEHCDGPKAACTGNSPGAKDGGARDRNQEQTATQSPVRFRLQKLSGGFIAAAPGSIPAAR